MNEDIFHLGAKALICNEDRVLLLKANPELIQNNNKAAYWDLPGGRIKRGDTIEETLKREIAEETGITVIISFQPFAIFTMPVRILTENTDVGLILSVYLVQVESAADVRLSSEHTEARWFTSQEAAHLLAARYPKEFVEKLNRIDETGKIS